MNKELVEKMREAVENSYDKVPNTGIRLLNPVKVVDNCAAVASEHYKDKDGVLADIRNKLTPLATYFSLVDEKGSYDDHYIEPLIEKEYEVAKASFKYICDLLSQPPQQ